jgi:hypothetical protein
MELFESGPVRELVFVLLPGFVAAWVFYGLTPHPKLNQFERTVQAFIFLAFMRIVMWGIEAALTSVPPAYALGVWGPEATFAWSLLAGIAIGLIFSACANHDFPHSLLRAIGVTKRTSFPSEWSSTFNREVRTVVLHVKDRCRVMGEPVEFPDHPDFGHFVLCDARWLPDEGGPTELAVVERLLIRASEVEIVETLKDPDAVTSCKVEDTNAQAQKNAKTGVAKNGRSEAFPNGRRKQRKK